MGDLQPVQEAAERVTRSGTGLYRLVNNAGVGDRGKLTWTEAELDNSFDGNILALFRLTNTFLPMLFEEPGWVVWWGSRAG